MGFAIHVDAFKTNSDAAPLIIGNDFWSKHNAVFDYPNKQIRLHSKQTNDEGDHLLTVTDVIPFTVSSHAPQNAASVTTAPASWDLTATRNMILDPGEGCVIGPTVRAEKGQLHRTTTLQLEPVISNLKATLNNNKANGIEHTRMYCTPTAQVQPLYLPKEERYAVATTVINMG